jgi:hypothetical protein
MYLHEIIDWLLVGSLWALALSIGAVFATSAVINLADSVEVERDGPRI